MVWEKALTTNVDYDGYLSEMPIRYSKNNSKANVCEFVIRHNCEWQVAFDGFVGNFMDFDIDFLCIARRSQGLVDENKDIVFWNNVCTRNHEICMMGGHVGEGCPPDEIFWIDFDKIDFDVLQIDFLTTIFLGDEWYVDFSPLTKLRVRIEADKDEIIYGSKPRNVFQYDIDTFPYKNTVVKIGSLFRENVGWSYKSTVMGFDMSLEQVVKSYGFDV